MARFYVVSETSQERVPFLRGILVQSLVAAGLGFEQAYSLSQFIRKEFGDAEEVTTSEIRSHVLRALELQYGLGIAENYARGPQRDQQITVRDPSRETLFSVGLLSHKLQACAISPRDAQNAAQRVMESLQKGGITEISHRELARVIYRVLGERCSMLAANRYLSWQQFQASGRPLILLIGGATGTGKSTVATELAFVINVPRTQSTDLMREIVRSYACDEAAAASLNYSSFEAWRGLPEADPDAPESAAGAERVVAGFMAQFHAVRDGIKATIQRALRERQDLILDGVHVIPTRLDMATMAQDALVVPVVLVVATRERLIRRFTERGQKQPGRGGSRRYLRNLDAIWEIQSFLVTEADGAGVPLIFSWTIEDSVYEILLELARAVARDYPPDPAFLD